MSQHSKEGERARLRNALFLVELEMLEVSERLANRVGSVPFDGLFDPIIKRRVRLPTEIFDSLTWIKQDSVRIVRMSRANLNLFLQGDLHRFHNTIEKRFDRKVISRRNVVEPL